MNSKFRSEYRKGRDHLEDLDVDEKLIWKIILKKCGGRIWTGFSWLRLGATSEHTNEFRVEEKINQNCRFVDLMACFQFLRRTVLREIRTECNGKPIFFLQAKGYLERRHTRGQLNNPRAESLTDRYCANRWEGHSEMLFSLTVPLWAAERLTCLTGSVLVFRSSCTQWAYPRPQLFSFITIPKWHSLFSFN